MSKLVTPDPVLAGTDATYTIQVRNNGPSTAVDVNLSDVFTGEAFTFIDVITPVGTCNYDNIDTLNCFLGDIPSGTIHSITMRIRPDQQVPTPVNWEINNTASVTMLTLDSNGSNNEKNATLQVLEGEVDLAIEKSESTLFSEPVIFDPFDLANNQIVYKIEIQNFGPSLATDIRFIDRVLSVSPDVDQNLTFVRDTANADGTDDGSGGVCTAPVPNPFTPDVAAPTIDCSIAELASGSSYVRYIVFRVEDAPNYVSGDVYRDEINVTSREVETLTGNNVEDERTTVRVYTDPQVVKNVSKTSVEVGENFTYTLVVTNNGPGYSPYTNVSDTLPANMELTGAPTTTAVDGNGTLGICTGVAGDTSFTCNVDQSDGTLHSQYNDPGGISEVNITVPVRFVSYPGAAPVINTAVVSTSGPDQNESNNESNVAVNVLAPLHIGDYVWEDLNANGVQDGNGPAIPGVIVNLLDSNGSILQTTTTDGSGLYGFDLNSSGDYRVQFITPAGYLITTQNSGDDTLDSDINATGFTALETLNYGDNNLTFDAGYFRVANIGDRVWIDDNGNGQQDAGELDVSGVDVRLYNDSNVQIITDIDGNVFGTAGVITTNVSGNYNFTNLRPGRYYVEFDTSTLPAGYVFTNDNIGANATDSDADRTTGRTTNRTLSSNETDNRLDAGIFIPVSIGDRTWYDVNGNGIQGVGEANLSNVGVALFLSDGTPVTTDLNGTALQTITDANGAYLFDNLKPDTYYVQFTPPAGGYVLTSQDQGGDDTNDSDANSGTGNTGNYTLNSGDDDLSVDAGFYIPIRIGDRVWEDRNYNGLQDNGELNVSGVTVTLVTDGTLGTEIRVTDGNGYYLFDDLAPGHQYSVEFSNLPAGYMFTVQDVGGDDTIDSDANVTTGRASGQTPIVVSDDENLTFDAGIYLPVVIGDRVWEDLNANGIQDSGEPGIDGVTVELYIDGNASGIITSTSGGGLYSFPDGLPNHTYSVAFNALPASTNPYVISPTDAGSDDTQDSDIVSLATPVQATPLMFSGESNLTLDAGFYRTASLGNRVWLDANGNGLQDSGESNVSGVTVSLYDVATNTLQDTNVTDANGLYHFDNLVPGDYYVVFDSATLPAGYVFTQQNSGGDNAIDSDVNRTTGRSDNVTLISNQDDNSTDAGIYLPVNVGDRIWVDINANGIQDVGELNYNGEINVTLIDNNDPTNTYSVTTTTGDYNITGVRPGNYHIEFTLPAGFNVSPNDVGDDNNDSDVVGLSTGNFDLVSGVNQYTWDMGIYQDASIGDRIWLDQNLNGIQEAEDINYNGEINVTLRNSLDVIVSTTTTNDGNYSFTGLTPGDYYVEFTLPNGYVLSPDNIAGDDTVDSDVNSTLRTVLTTLSSGENDLSWDMGIGLIDLNIIKVQSGGQNPVLVPGDINYSITVENNGTVTLTNPVLTDLMPDASSVVLTLDSGDTNSDGNIDVGETWTYLASYTVTQADIDAGVNLVNLATIATTEVADKNDTAVTPIVQNPDLNIIKVLKENLDEDNTLNVSWGDTLIYEVNGTNTGNITLHNVIISDTKIVPSSITCLTLAPGEVCTLEGNYTVTQTDLLAGDINNTGTADSNETLPIDVNITTPVYFSHVFDPPSALKIANPGGWPEIEWKMVWINDGNSIAYRVHVEDPLSADLTYIPGTLNCDARGASTTDANATGCYYDVATRTVIWNGSIAPDLGKVTEDTADNEVVITFRTTVPDSIDEVENQGIAYWDEDGDGNVDFNKTVTTDDPSTNSNDDATKASNPRPTPTPTPTPIPDVPVLSGPDGVTINPLGTGESLVGYSQGTHGSVFFDDGGTPNDPTDDTLRYVPNDGYSGTDTFTYTIRDKDGNLVTKTVNVSVPKSVGSQGTTLNVLNPGESLLSFTQPEHGIVTLDDGGTPDDPTDDVLRYIPSNGYSGSDSFTYTILDNNGDVVIKTMLLNVEFTNSDNGETSSGWSLFVLVLLTTYIGLYYVRREEEYL